MKFAAFDIETNGLPYIEPGFKIIMIATDDGERVRVWGRNSIGKAVSWLQEAQQRGEALVGHNASMFDRPAIKRVYGHNFKCHDTQFMAYLLDEEHQDGKYKLENLAVAHLGVPVWKNEVTWDWRDTNNWDDDDPRWAIMAQYCARDTRYTRQLAEQFSPKLVEEQLWVLYSGLLLPASRALSNIYERGVGVSHSKIAEAREFFNQQKAEASQVLVGAGFVDKKGRPKPGSTLAMRRFLFEQHGIEPIFWTDGGDPSLPNHKGPQPQLNKLALKTYRARFSWDRIVPVIDAKLEYSEAQKMESTYLKNYVKFSQSNSDGRLHPNYSLTNTTSGRTSAFDPNIQNPPRLTAIRRVLGAPRPGFVYLQADLSQLELRMAAHVFGERNMIAAFKRDDDLHYLMAEKMTGKTREQIEKEERTTAKIANFLLLYGAETQTFVDSAFVEYDLVFSWADANNIRDSFHQTWPDLFPAYNKIYQELTKYEYVTTITGMRRRFPGFNALADYAKTKRLREAVNDLVQSPSSHLALTMLVQLEGMGFFNTAYIHDAVQLEVLDNPDKISDAAQRIKHAVSVTVPELFKRNFGVELLVPIKCDIEVGPSWGELEKYPPKQEGA